MLKKNLLTLFIASSAVALTACPKEEQPADDDAETTTTSGEGEDDVDTSTEETGTDTGESEAESADTSGFLPDVADEGNSCDPWSPNDCPDGEKCAAWAAGDTWDSNKCVPINGTGVTGDECTYDGATLGTDTCDSGYMCYYTTDGVGSCIPLCTGSAEDPQCPDNFNCSISNDGSLLLCLPSCDPLLQDCSIEGTACYFDGELFNCDPAGEIAENSECGYINDCFPGGICLDASVFPDCSGAACCGAYCDLDDPTCSLDGTECVAFWEEGEAPPGQENLGLCILPG